MQFANDILKLRADRLNLTKNLIYLSCIFYFSCIEIQVFAQSVCNKNVVVCSYAASPSNITLHPGQYIRQKLDNPAYFGSTGSLAPETFSYVELQTVSKTEFEANNCNIFFTGRDGDYSFNANQKVELADWLDDGGERFMLSGCDNNTYNDAFCNAVNRPVTSHVGAEVDMLEPLSANPLSCLGSPIYTDGKDSGYFGGYGTDIPLAVYQNDPTKAVVITNSISGNANYLLTGDLNMWMGVSQISPGPNITLANDKFIANTFRYAVDNICQRAAPTSPNFKCPTSAGIDLELSKNVDVYSPNTGDLVNYTITVENTGAGNATGVEIQDLLPSGLSIENVITSVGSWADPTWSLGRLDSEATATLVIEARVNVGGVITNCAQISKTDQHGSSLTDLDSDPGVADISTEIEDDESCVDITSTVVVAPANLSVTKSVDSGSSGVNRGDLVTYTLTLSNAGGTDAIVDAISDTLGVELIFDSLDSATTTCTGITSASVSGGLLSFTALPLIVPANDSCNIVYRAVIDASGYGAVSCPNAGTTNTVVVSEGGLAKPAQSVCVPVDAEANPSSVCGANIVVCSHAGSYGDITNGSSTPMRAKLSNSAFFGPSGSLAPETFSFKSIPTITKAELEGNSCNIYFSGYDTSSRIDATEQTALADWLNADIERFVMSGCDGVSTDAVCEAMGRPVSAYSNIPVNLTSDTLQNPLSCLGGNPVYTSGGVSSYFGSYAADIPLTVYQDDTSKVETITDSISGNAKYLLTGDINMWLGNPHISSGPNISKQNDKFIANTFRFAADNMCGRAGVNFSCPSAAGIDLELTKSVDNSTPSNGDTFTYTISLSNTGSGNATSVQVQDILPADLSIVSVTPSVGSWSAPVWTVGSLAGAGVASLQITTTLTASSATITNCAQVSSTDQQGGALADTDSTPGSIAIVKASEDDESCVSIAVQDAPTPRPDPAELVVTKTYASGTSTVNRGDTLTYTVTLTNIGGTDATVTNIVDTLGADLSFGALDAATNCDGILNANSLADVISFSTFPLTIQPTESCKIVYTATVNPIGTNQINCPNIDMTNSVEVTTTDLDPPAASVCVPVHATPADLSVTKSVDSGTSSVSRGDTVTYTLTFKNDGGTDAFVTNIVDTLGADLSFDALDSSTTCAGITSANSLLQTLAFSSLPLIVAASSSCRIVYTAIIAPSGVGAVLCPNTGTTNSVEVAADGSSLPAQSVCVPVNGVPLTAYDLVVTKSVDKQKVTVGEIVRFTLSGRNKASWLRVVDVIDRLPHSLTYLSGTATYNGIADEPIQNGRDLIWQNKTLQSNGMANSSYEISFYAVVNTAAGLGTIVNAHQVLDSETGVPLSPIATVSLRVLANHTFDCSGVVGRVFNDLNGDGYFDDGEFGIPAARVFTVDGQAVRTDEYGRFHVPCAAIPNQDRGSNFILKLDKKSLPLGYQLTTENPRVVRLTSGKMTKINFGASISKVYRVVVDDRAFVPNVNRLNDTYANVLGQLVNMLSQSSSVLKIRYNLRDESDRLARSRVNAFAIFLQRQVKRQSPYYKFEVNTEIVRRK